MESPYLVQIVRIERMRGHLEYRRLAQNYGSNLDNKTAARAASGALGSCGLAVGDEDVAALVRGEPAGEGRAGALALGYVELLRLVVAHYAEIPFLENQIKYFHSTLLRHDDSAIAHRRIYRRADGPSLEGGLGAPAEAVPGLMAALVGRTRGILEEERHHPLIAAAEFFRDFLRIRPFTAGNRLLALGLVDYLLLRYGYDHILIEPLETAIEPRRDLFAEAAAGSAVDPPGEADRSVVLLLEAIAESQQRALEALAPHPAPRINARQERILTILADRGAAKIGDILAILEVPRATLKKDLRELVACQRVVATGVRKGTVYRIGEQW